jgi:hypothetical protein
MLRNLIEFWLPPPLTDGRKLGRFLSGEASYLAQRTTYEFTRNTLAWHGQAAFGDDGFNAVFRICRWESFASILSGFVVLTHIRLRAAAGDPGALASPLLQLFTDELAAYPTPAHRADWVDVTTRLAQRLTANARPTPAEIGSEAALRVYETIPVRSAHAAEDRDVLANAIRLGTISVHDRLATRLRPDAVNASLRTIAPPSPTATQTAP